MSQSIQATIREAQGTGASRRLRRAGQVPAVIYGGEKAPQSISLLAKEIAKLLENDSAYSHVIALTVDGAVETVVIKALQRHPAKGHVLHADFVRVVAGQKLTAHVPLHFLNQESSVGVKQQGGEVSHSAADVEVSCLPKDLPEFINVDMANVEVGQILHMSDLVLPAGVELVALAHGKDLPIANIHASRVVKDAE